MNARWYDPTVGRFLTQDTYRGEMTNPQTQNRYAYVMNNPANLWDPTGHVAVEMGRYDSSNFAGATFVDPIESSGAFGFSDIPGWVFEKRSVKEDYSFSETDLLVSYYEYLFKDHDWNVIDGTVQYQGKEEADARNFYYQFTGQVDEEWDYSRIKHHVILRDGIEIAEGDSIPAGSESFTRKSYWTWDVLVPAALAHNDHQQYIVDNFGKLPSYINLSDMDGYDRGTKYAEYLTRYGVQAPLMSTGERIIVTGLEIFVYPFGAATDLYRVKSGKDPYTGQTISTTERVLSGVALVPGAGIVTKGSLGIIKVGGKIIQPAIDIGSKTLEKIKGLFKRPKKPEPSIEPNVVNAAEGTDKFLLGGPGYLQTFASKGIDNSGGLLWGRWKDYNKVNVNGTEYAQIGDRLYTRHACR